MSLKDPDNIDDVKNFYKFHMSSIEAKEGWIFISTREVARGLDLRGIEAATMILNFNFANATELNQTLGRGNRNPFDYRPVKSYIFIDEQFKPTLESLKLTDQSFFHEKSISTFCNIFKGITIHTPAT
jgi:hypothetical protein